MINFSDLFRQKRIEGGLTLRSFCEKHHLDPAYISRLETGNLNPPKDRGKLSSLAQALNIQEKSSDWINFFDQAYLAKGEIPQDILEDKKSLKYLPLLFRTARGKKLSKKKLQELIKLINNA
ncbi:MAG: helix-turn-helix transcriptional regulator [Candidatus Woesebacteria bacterium]|nr:helix-turn-helix transcriptional regulator [Candidatus Woesebacteria bacterium]